MSWSTSVALKSIFNDVSSGVSNVRAYATGVSLRASIVIDIVARNEIILFISII